MTFGVCKREQTWERDFYSKPDNSHRFRSPTPDSPGIHFLALQFINDSHHDKTLKLSCGCLDRPPHCPQSCEYAAPRPPESKKQFAITTLRLWGSDKPVFSTSRVSKVGWWSCSKRIPLRYNWEASQIKCNSDDRVGNCPHNVHPDGQKWHYYADRIHFKQISVKLLRDGR